MINNKTINKINAEFSQDGICLSRLRRDFVYQTSAEYYEPFRGEQAAHLKSVQMLRRAKKLDMKSLQQKLK